MKKLLNTTINWQPVADKARWYSQRTGERLGRVGVFALFVLVVSVIYGVVVALPRAQMLREERQVLSDRLESLEASASSVAARLEVDTALPEGDPTARKFALVDALKRHQVTVEETTFQTDVDKARNQIRRTVVFVGHARYPDLAEALQALRAQPTVRVEEMTMERTDIGNERLRVMLRVSMLLGRP
ncbi:hypothetical protein [Pandoraea commovens]|uniref:Uncharacterized protein n=1 Tax=Pandoraea commovens TaxID=2508289 RepID=A0A5E4WB30_9BURK|nr:hypothetical protein [Pandoraea commovens]VVE20736.1 hypothetical protein PCO31010_03147 [Pandoraea commovens]